MDKYWPFPPIRRFVTKAFRKEGWVIALTVLTSLGVVVTIALWFYLVYRMVKSRSRLRTVWHGQVLLAGILFSYIVLYAFLPQPTPATCGVIRFGIGFTYAVCFATLLLKLTIIIARHRGVFLPLSIEILLLILAIGIQVAINSQWLIDLHPRDAYLLYSDGTTDCNIRLRSWLCSLSYVMLLILVGTGSAIAARRIKDNHREPVFIGLAFGFSIPIWLVWIFVAAFVDSNNFIEEKCLAFGLLANASLILFAMFIPKVRQLSAIGAIGLYREDRPIPKTMTEMTVQKIYYPVYPENGTRPLQLDVGRYMRHLYGNATSALSMDQPPVQPRYYHYPHDELFAGPSSSSRRSALPPSDEDSTIASYREDSGEESDNGRETPYRDAGPTYAQVQKHMVY